MSHARDVSKFVKFITDDYKVAEEFIDSDTLAVTANKSLRRSTGTKGYNNPNRLPANAPAGSQAFVNSNNRLYVSNGSGWYHVAVINQAPYWITQPDGSYTLSTTGVATTITILGGDSDGHDVPQYTATGDSNFNAIATVTKDSDSGRVFVVRSIDSESSASPTSGTGTLTFTLSDGKQSVLVNSTFSIDFGPDWSIQPNNVPLPHPPQLTSGDQYGFSSSISGDGNYAIVGANNATTNHIGGTAAVYLRTGDNTWAFQSDLALINQNYLTSSQMGTSVDISSDGSTAVVGAPNYTGSSGTNNGVVLVYVRSGTTWTLQATITGASNPVNHGWTYQGNNNRQIGRSLSISDDGNTFVSGSRYDGGISSYQGVVYVLQRTGTSWSGTTIQAFDSADNDLFGTNTAISGDGNYIIVGAPGEQGGGGNPYPAEGCIYVFKKSGSSFNYQTTLRPTHSGVTRSSSSSHWKQIGGSGLAINQDGSQVLAGGYYDSKVYTWSRSGTSWTAGSFLVPSIGGVNYVGGLFGRHIAIDNAGDNAFINFNTVATTGAWVHYTRSGNTWTLGNYGPWTVTTSGWGGNNASSTYGARMGYNQGMGNEKQQLSVSGDGSYVLFSGRGGYYLGGDFTGEAHVFKG